MSATVLEGNLLHFDAPFSVVLQYHDRLDLRQFYVYRLLGKVFHTDFQLQGANETLGPHITDFIASVIPQLEVLKSLNITVNSGNGGPGQYKH